MIILSLIRALLEEDSVTITGLGTFYVKKNPAQIKEDIIFPPQNFIELEYSKDAEGFDFTSKVSKWEQIRIDEAQFQVSEWLNLLEKGLEYNKTVFFDDFGTFSKDFSGKMAFQSVINSQLNIENEGFEPILVPHREREENYKETVKEKRLILDKKEKKSDKFWFALIIFIALATIGTLFLKDKFYSFFQISFIKDKISMPSESVDTEIATYIDSLKKEIIEATYTFEEEVKEEVKEEGNNTYLSYEKGKYYVIAGSFTKEADALRHIKQQRLEKYHAKLIVHPDSPRIRVAIGVFDNEGDANNFALQIDKNYWVLK